MGRVSPLFVLVFLMLLFNINLSASEISYNDIAVPTNYELTSGDFNHVNLTINGKAISYSQLNIIEQTSSYIIASYEDNTTTFNFKININRNDITDTVDAVNEHSLQIDDEGPLLSTSKLTCNVTSLTKEDVEVQINTDTKQSGITNGVVLCNSTYINTSRSVDVININEYSNYNIEGNEIIYAEDFGFDLNNASLDTLSNEEILDFSNVDTTRSNVSVELIGNDFVTFTDGNLSVTNSIYLDEAPKLNTQNYYELNFNNNDKLIDELEITDDNDSLDELDISYEEFSEPGIYESSVEITDSALNSTKQEVLVIVNDGRYYISEDGKYVLDNTSREVSVDDDELEISAYDIDSRSYINVDSKILYEQDDTEEEVIQPTLNNEYSDIMDENTNSYMYLIYIIMFIIIVALIKFL